jgi:nicotinamide mononucleotide adenylyltransferase
MSKEKDLLKRVRDTLHELKETHYDLYWDIQTALDQLEQTEQEPVGYLYKQMDCYGEWATIFKFDNPSITWHVIKDIVPVYTGIQKQEPLSGKEVKEMYLKHELSMIKKEYIYGFRDAEKHYGIGE